MTYFDQNKLDDFKKKGWLQSEINIPGDQLEDYSKSVLNIVANVKKNKFPFGRIYHDYLFDYNLAAVEAPFSNIICSENVIDFFSKIEIGSMIKTIKGWKEVECSLVRLFCMGDYNYSGHWHKDDVSEGNSIQVSILLKPEMGFKILKNKHKVEFDNQQKENINSVSSKFQLPIKFKNYYYDVIDGKKGDIIFFEPSLLHKGSSNKSRLQFHMRFHEIKNLQDKNNLYKNNKLDFYMKKIYDPNYKHDLISSKLPKIKRANSFSRLKNLINYFFPIFNFYYFLKQKKIEKNFDYEILSNTFYQKQD